MPSNSYTSSKISAISSIKESSSRLSRLISFFSYILRYFSDLKISFFMFGYIDTSNAALKPALGNLFSVILSCRKFFFTN